MSPLASAATQMKEEWSVFNFAPIYVSALNPNTLAKNTSFANDKRTVYKMEAQTEHWM